MRPKAAQIVQTVTATTMAELRRRRDEATDGDLVELRLDGVGDVDVAGALGGRRTPAIVTCRPVWEGGRWDGSEESRRRLLDQAVRLGAEFVDVEHRAAWMPDPGSGSTRVVVSAHDFTGIPADLTARVLAMRATGAAMVKIAVTASHVTDVLRLREAMEAAGSGGDLVCIAMGEAGQLTRLIPSRFGSCWTYGGEAAPGQVPARHLRERYRCQAVTTETRLFGVAGAPIAHSASPAMHNAAYAALGLDAVYVPVLAADVEEAAAIAERLGFSGLSLTAPLKGGWLARPGVAADDTASRRLGVINTLTRHDAGWLARNLDIDGFLEALDVRAVPLRSQSVLVLGAGGAARSAAWALRERGALVTVVSRRDEAAARLAADLDVAARSWPPTGVWDVVVNATPVGTWPAVDRSPVEWDTLEARVAYDLVYNPEETAFLREARARGAQVIGGLDMLVGQAARQCAWWTGRDVDRRVMRDTARALVRESNGS